MIEIEAAQIKLVRLPAAAVLRNDDAGDGLDYFANARERSPRKLGLADVAFIRGPRAPDEIFSATFDDDSVDRRNIDVLRERRRGEDRGDKDQTDYFDSEVAHGRLIVWV